MAARNRSALLGEVQANAVIQAMGLKASHRSGESAARVASITARKELSSKVAAIIEEPDKDLVAQELDYLAQQQLDEVLRAAASRVYNARKDITGYRRIIHPEISKSGSTCGLCIAASQNFYHTPDLAKIHDHCHCAVLPIVKSIDPGQLLNSKELAALYKQAGGTSDKKLSSSRARYAPSDGNLGDPIARTDSQDVSTQAESA